MPLALATRGYAARPRTIEHHRLTPQAANLLQWALTELGFDAGVIEDQAPVTDPATRSIISDFAANAAGIRITPGHEIAQCADCLDVMDGALAHEDDGYIRCDDCRALWQLSLYGGPDTTAEADDWAA